MKKILLLVLCLVLIFTVASCGKKVDLDDKPTITGKVIDWWGTSVTIEVAESSIDSIKEGSKVFFEQDDMDNYKKWIELTINDQVQVIFDVESVLDGDPISLEKVYEINHLNEN